MEIETVKWIKKPYNVKCTICGSNTKRYFRSRGEQNGKMYMICLSCYDRHNFELSFKKGLVKNA